MTSQKNKFRGGLRVGIYSNTWPNGLLEVNRDNLILHDETMKKNYEFYKDDVDRIKIIKIFPIIGYGVRIYHHKKDYSDKIYFWFVGIRFARMLSALKDAGWRVN